MPKAQVNGITLDYEIAGSGPPLLLISGLGGNKMGWLPAVPLLSGDYTVITFDNRGTGLSDVPPGPYDMADLAADTAGLIEHLDLGPVSAIGVSMGGLVLQRLLIDHPGSVSRAVLLSTFPSYTKVQDYWLDGLRILRQQNADPFVQSTAVLPWVLTSKTLFDHEKTNELLQLMTSDPMPTTLEGYEAQAHGTRNFNSLDELHKIDTPTLVLVGAEDILTPPFQSVQIAERIPGAKLEILPKGNHGMYLEYPVETIGAARRFLDAAVPATA